MNEQELPNLYGMLTTGNVTLLSDSHPRVAETLDHMRHVYRTMRAHQEAHGFRKLTRSGLFSLFYTTVGSFFRITAQKLRSRHSTRLIIHRETLTYFCQ